MVVKLPTTNVDILPSRYTVISLVQHYIDHDLSFYPFLPEAKIFGSIEALYEGRAAPSDEWTVFLILAIALSSLSGSQEDGRYAEAVRYAGAVLEHAKLVLLPGSLQAIQMVGIPSTGALGAHYLDFSAKKSPVREMDRSQIHEKLLTKVYADAVVSPVLDAEPASF